MSSYNKLVEELDRFIDRYYNNEILKGVFVSLGLDAILFIIFSIIENFLYLNTVYRSLIFYFCLVFFGIAFVVFVLRPLLQRFLSREFAEKFLGRLSRKQAAKLLQKENAVLGEKLYSVLELQEMNSGADFGGSSSSAACDFESEVCGVGIGVGAESCGSESDVSELVASAIEQISSSFLSYKFSKFIKYIKVLPSAKYLITALVLVILCLIFVPKIILSSPKRILNYNTEFEREFPFSFVLNQDSLFVIYGEDYVLRFRAEGSMIPKDVEIEVWSAGEASEVAGVSGGGAVVSGGGVGADGGSGLVSEASASGGGARVSGSGVGADAGARVAGAQGIGSEVLEKKSNFGSDSGKNRRNLDGGNNNHNKNLKKQAVRYQCKKLKNSNIFEYKFKKLKENTAFRILAGSYVGEEYILKVISPPEIDAVKVQLNYPKYINLEDKELNGILNFDVPRGTFINWEIFLKNSDGLEFIIETKDSVFELGGDFEKSKIAVLSASDLRSNNVKQFKYKAQETFSYALLMKAKDYEKYRKIDSLKYRVNVLEDKYPYISTNLEGDTVFGQIRDDYGFYSLNYRIGKNTAEGEEILQKYPIRINSYREENTLAFSADFIQVLNLEKLSSGLYFADFEVRDNDEINGYKAQYSKKYEFRILSEEEKIAELNNLQSNINKSILSAQTKEKELKNNLNDLENSLIQAKNLGWQEEQKLKQLFEKENSSLEEKEKLLQDIFKKAEEENKLNKYSDEFLRKEEILQELMQKELMEERKSLEENRKNKEGENLNQVMEKIKQWKEKHRNLSENWTRNKEMYKRLDFEKALEKIIDDTKKLAAKQDSLSREDFKRSWTADSTGFGRDDSLTLGDATTERNVPYGTVDKNMETEKFGGTVDSENVPRGTLDKDTTTLSENSANSVQNKNVPRGTLEENTEKLDGAVSDKNVPRGTIEEKQDEIKNDFDKLEQSIRTAEKLNKDLKKPNDFKTPEKELDEIRKNLNEIKNNIKQNNLNRVKEGQKNVSRNLRNLAQKLGKQKEQMQSQSQEEDAEFIRLLLKEILRASFEEERIVLKTKETQVSQPAYAEIIRRQDRINKDLQLIIDSLNSIATRQIELAATLFEEIRNIKTYSKESLGVLLDKNDVVYRFYKYRNSAATVAQQRLMTSLNKMALILAESLDNMQASMNSSGGGSGREKSNSSSSESGEQSGKDKSEGEDGGEDADAGSDAKEKMASDPKTLGEMQEALDKRMQQLMDKMNGRFNEISSEDLMRAALEQEMIRRELSKQIEKSGAKNEKNAAFLNSLLQDMERTEKEIVNKKLSKQTLNRQRLIETRLLEAEKAILKQKEDERRESREARQFEIDAKEATDDTLRLDKRTFRDRLNNTPEIDAYYKKLIDAYFGR